MILKYMNLKVVNFDKMLSFSSSLPFGGGKNFNKYL